MRNITLKSLIKEQEKRIPSLQEKQTKDCVSYDYPNKQAYYIWVEIAKMLLTEQFPKNKLVVDFCNLSNEAISLDQQLRLLAKLKAFDINTKIKTYKNNVQIQKENKIVVSAINNNCQSQNQSQIIQLFFDSTTDCQIKEHKSIVTETNNELHKPSSGIITKFKKLSGNVASNIIVNILTNPNFWKWLIIFWSEVVAFFLRILE